MLKGSNKLKKVILAILSIVAILGIATTASKIANNQKAKIMPASTHVTGQYDLVQPGDENLPETPNVQFDAYFLNDSVKTRGALLGPINKVPQPIPTKELYVELKILGEGKFKDGEIKFEQKNHTLIGTLASDNVIDGIYDTYYRPIKLKEITNGTTKVIRLEARPIVKNKDDFYRNDNKVILTGKYVNNDGNEIEVTKTINYSIETMYNNLTSSLEVRTNNDTYRYSDNERPFFRLEMINKAEQFSNRDYSLNDTQKSNVFKINDIPKFNGYQPENIRAYYTRKFDNNFSKNIETIVYDKVGNTLEINNLTYNREDWIINILFEYPRESGKEHKSEELEMHGTYDVSAYNNDNFPELIAPTIETVINKKIEYVKPTEYRHIYPNLSIYDSILGDNARKIYDNEEYDRYDRYTVSWTPYDITAKTKNTTLSEDKSIEGDFLSKGDNSEEKINISDIVVNKSMIFYFTYKKEQILEEDSRIEVYDDETNQIIRTLNKEEIIKQERVKYNFEKPIKHIKVKFINIAINNPENTIKLDFFKEIDNEKLTQKIDRDTFEKIKYISTSLQMEIDGNNKKMLRNRGYGTPRPQFYYKMNFNIEHRSKYIEQGKYNGQDTSELENEFIYKISHEALKIILSPSYRRFGLNNDEIKKYIKEIKFEDKHGMYVLNNMGEVSAVPGAESVDYIKYKGIYFENYTDNIPEESYVKVYNSKTNELIHTFTAEEIKKYNSRKDAFIYPNEIKAIRIEMNRLIYISNIMRVDENEVVRLEEKNNYLNNKNIILNNPEYSVIEIKDNEYSAPTQTRVYGSMVNSHATVRGSLDRPLNTYSVQKDVNQSVSVGYSGSNGSSLYPVRIIKKETILIKYPKEVKSVKINNIKASGAYINHENPPKIIGYEQFEKEGFQYLKVYIDTEKFGGTKEIIINSDIRIDPTIEKQSLYATIYHYNNFLNSYERSTKDIEDINSNGDFEENVGLGGMQINVVTPDTVIMSQNLTNYNTKGDVTYGPNTGIIENNGTGNATVNINLTNRWSPTISNVKIIGRIPYKGNQTAISKKNLKSTFNTFLTGPIRIPAELTGKARIYYSEIESNNDIDINNTTYNWKEDTIENHNQINWENIKSFYIDLGDSTINAGSKLTFSYDIRVPVVNRFNERSYATAAALFDFNTHKDGNIKSNAESDRVGVIFLKRYNLNISALIKGNKNPIAKSIYKIENYEEDDDKIVKIGETDSQGRAVVKDLRVNERYKLTEETTDSDYIINKQSVDFTLKELDDGNLALEIQKDGNIVETSVIQPTETENATVNINMEYLQKYSLIINKLDKESRTPVKGAAYVLKPTTDNGESHISGSTNENGEVVFKGLIPKVNYTLEEKSSPKYYLNPRVKYEVSEVNGTYSINITEGEVENKELTQNNVGLNNSKITLLGEKIKTYAININKYEKGKNKKLSKAQFKVVGDGYENGKTIETNDEGIAKLEGLYEYREDKDYTAEYTVKEIIAPDGYKKSEGTLKFKVQRNSNNEMELKVLEDTLTKKNKSDTNGNKGIRIENSIVNIDIENELFFKLIKKDGKTEERLSNTKFVIYKVNKDGTDEVALDIKGNKVGTLERDTNIPNGEGYVVTTNESGEISLALPEGKYKFIEIQAPDYKYDLPSSESERTYYFTVKDNKTTYKLVENENIKKVLKESYGPGEGEIDSTYVNGKTIHYKLDKEGEKYHLRFYDNKFDVIKNIELNYKIDNLKICDIGNNGIIYTISGQKIIKFSNDGSYIGEYLINGNGMEIINYVRSKKSTLFGSKIFDNNKVIVNSLGVNGIYNIDTGEILRMPVIKRKAFMELAIEKPSYNGGFVRLDKYRKLAEGTMGVVNIYDNNMNLIKEFPVKLAQYGSNIGPNRINNFEEFHEDAEGNIYINSYIDNSSEDQIEVFDREGNLQKTIQKPLEYFKVLPDGKIYFYGFDGTKNKVILTDNNGNKLAEKDLEGNNVKLDSLKINADGSIEYSDNNQNLITHKLDLIEEASNEEQQSELVVTNNWKKYKITTSAGEHGTISGAGETPYEEVEIYSNATKEITITPEEGYRIKKVTINGATVPITLNSDNKTMTITKFENMTENKDIKAEFSNQGVTIRTNHYIKDTTTPVSQSEVQSVDMGENYTTAPKTLAKYELEKNERGEYVIPTNASGTVPLVTNPADKRDIEVTYYYTKKKAKVITKYLLDKGDGNTEEIKTPNEQTLEIDTQYTTSSDVGNPKYELIRVDGNSTGTIENTDDITVTYIYRVKRAKVIVKYLDVTESETGTPLPSNDGATVEDVEINGQVDDGYRTSEANNVQPNYSLVETPRNASGTMTIAPTTVVYKYRKVAPTINNINVTKVGPNKIASKTQLNTYNITFNVNLSNYIGSGSVKLTDKLPYGIHHEASDELASGLALDGGVYNDETKEIVWNIPISDINSYKQSIERNEHNTIITQDGTSVNVTINKTISIRYKDLPNYNQGEEPKIENSIFGKIILDRNNEREVNSKSNSPANYNTSITVKKKWNDNSNSAEKRPTSITFALYKTINGQETKVKDYTLTGSTTTDDG